jgi:serine protease inhibitor
VNISRTCRRTVALAILMPLAACASADPQAGFESAAGVTLRTVTLDGARALPSVVDATRRLGAAMLADAPSGVNVVTSPASLEVALGMLAEGARGRTLAELDAVLGASGDERKDAFAALRGTLLRMDGDPALVRAKDLPERPLVHLADQVVVDDAFPISPDYLTALAEDFGAGMQRTDLASADGKRVLDAWVDHHTGGLVKQSAIQPSPSLRAVLQDAILLAARWEEPFSPHGTAPQSFTLSDGTRVGVETMASLRAVAYAEADGWQAVRLPYVDGALHADLLLPPAGADPASVTPELLAKVSAALDQATPVEVELTLPTLDLKPDPLDLKDMLVAVGATNLWCGTAVDLTGVGPEDLCVSQVVQQAVLAVDEEGTVAAAVTEVAMTGSAPGEPARVLHLDRPFLMQIAATQTSWPLFLAAVRDPRH